MNQTTSGVFRSVDHKARPEPAPRQEKLGEAGTGILASLDKSVPQRNHTSESDLSNSRKQRVGNGRDEEQVKAGGRETEEGERRGHHRSTAPGLGV